MIFLYSQHFQESLYTQYFTASVILFFEMREAMKRKLLKFYNPGHKYLAKAEIRPKVLIFHCCKKCLIFNGKPKLT